jgi:hypothetical protein
MAEGMDITLMVLEMLKKNQDIAEIHEATNMPTEKILGLKEILGV